MQSFTYTIKEEMGLHARPAGIMVKELKNVPCSVTVRCGERHADGKRLFALMGMAVKCGETVTVEVEGEEEQAVTEHLKAFFAENF